MLGNGRDPGEEGVPISITFSEPLRAKSPVNTFRYTAHRRSLCARTTAGWSYAMYMRLMRLKALLGKSEEFCEFYKSEVLAELRRSGGCLFATLTEGLKNPDQFVSLTLWNDLEDIKRYEEGGRYQALLELTQQFLAESGEWRVQLSDDLTLDYGPSKEAPKVTAYRLAAGMESEELADVRTAPAHVRIMRFNVAPDKIAKFSEGYREDFTPAIQKVPGCLYAGLLANLEAEHQLASITIWASREDAERYEQSEVFSEYMQKGREVVGARSWDLMLDPTDAASPSGDKRLSAQAYHVVAGQNLSAS